MPAWLQLGLLLGAGLVTAGCASVGRDTLLADVAAGQGHLIAGVPFEPGDAYDCGPAALAMVLRYHGAAVTAGEIARQLYLPSVRGVLNLELELAARRRGFRARAFEATLDEARALLRQGAPLIVFLDVGTALGPAPHFAVLLGYDDRAGVAVLHSGPTAYRTVPYPAFARFWAARRGWTLLVEPGGGPG